MGAAAPVKDIPCTIKLVHEECLRRGTLDPRLICAVIDTESSFEPYTIRFEPRSMRPVASAICAKTNGITLETEENAQRFSWGLGQVLGSTARWVGFRDLLPALCDAATGIYWLCETFERLGEGYKETAEKIAAYNAGSVQRRTDGTFINQNYVDRVQKFLSEKSYGG